MPRTRLESREIETRMQMIKNDLLDLARKLEAQGDSAWLNDIPSIETRVDSSGTSIRIGRL